MGASPFLVGPESAKPDKPKTEGTPDDQAKERNKLAAERELTHIAVLQSDPSFQWFWENCVERGFKEARGKMEDESASDPERFRALAKFHVWRYVIQWLDTREREHRRLLNPGDPLIARANERISLH